MDEIDAEGDLRRIGNRLLPAFKPGCDPPQQGKDKGRGDEDAGRGLHQQMVHRGGIQPELVGAGHGKADSGEQRQGPGVELVQHATAHLPAGEDVQVVHRAEVILPEGGVEIPAAVGILHHVEGRDHHEIHKYQPHGQQQSLYGQLILDDDGEGDGGVQAHDHGHVPHACHGGLVLEEHGLRQSAQDQQRPAGEDVRGRVQKDHEKVHDEVPDFRGDQQAQQIVAVEPLQIACVLHFLFQQQRAGDHEKHRNADVAEDGDHCLKGRVPQGDGLEFRLLVVIVVVGAVDRVIQGDGNNGHHPGKIQPELPGALRGSIHK